MLRKLFPTHVALVPNNFLAPHPGYIPYPGVGDEAWVNSWNVLTARKEDAGVVLDLPYYHNSDDTTRALANRALSSLTGGNSASKTE